MKKNHILIIGTGSAGKRHGENLHKLGCRISCMDPRGDRIEEMKKKIPIRKGYLSFEEAIKDATQFSGVVIASPPSFHVEQSVAALKLSLPVLLEKPVSPDLKSAMRLAECVKSSGTPLLLGYTWRWWPAVSRLKELLQEDIVGKLRFVRFTMSAHLADWHPWERYQDFFMAHTVLGGGALLDESHWIDLMIMLFGMPAKVYARIEKLSTLEIDSDDNVDMLIEYADDKSVNIHLDLYGRPHVKSIRFIGEKGSVSWEPNEIGIYQGVEATWRIEKFNHERNDMFVRMAEEYLGILDGVSIRTCRIEDGLKVLTLIEAARDSNKSKKAIDIR